ncbi:MAG TPA: hypothetical protein VHG71_05380 [Verrucomicrobiae bacterium]|nr:hypothetical protein [Verrucomicrobiae bacterium]
MKLPNADKAIVERDKIENYLLDASHPDNGGKAQFFGGGLSGVGARSGSDVSRLIAARPEICYRWPDSNAGRQTGKSAGNLDCGQRIGNR